MDAEVGFQDAVAAAQLRRLRNRASCFGPRANIPRRAQRFRQVLGAKEGRHAARRKPETGSDDDTQDGLISPEQRRPAHAQPLAAQEHTAATPGFSSFLATAVADEYFCLTGRTLLLRCCGN